MTAYVSLPGSGTTRVSTPDSAALSLTGDLDVRGLVIATDWTPAALQVFLSHRQSVSNQKSWLFGVAASGVLQFTYSANGTAETNVVSTVATGATNGTHLWVRVTHDVDNGAAGNDVAFYTSTEPITTDPASVTWTQLGTTVTTAGTTSHFNSATALLVGATDNGSSFRLNGRAYYAELRSSIAGTIVGSPDFRDGVQTSNGGLTFVDPQANTWTLQTAAKWTGAEVSPAVEAETANPVTPLRSVTVGQATEVETGGQLTPSRTVVFGQAVEVELGQSFTPVILRAVSVGTAVERELARLMLPVQTSNVEVEDVVCRIEASSATCYIVAASAVCRIET